MRVLCVCRQQIDSQEIYLQAWPIRQSFFFCSMGNMELEDEDDEFTIAQFERQWRLHMADFERQRLKCAGFCCGHDDILYDVDASIFDQEIQQLYIQSTLKAAASTLIGTNNSLGVFSCKVPAPNGGKFPINGDPKVTLTQSSVFAKNRWWQLLATRSFSVPYTTSPLSTKFYKLSKFSNRGLNIWREIPRPV